MLTKYSAGARLDRLPMSHYHRIILLIIALAFMFDSIELGMMTFLLGSIRAEFGLTAAQAGLLGSSSFVGMVFGAAIAGYLADRFGRRPIFQLSIVIWGGASLLCSFAQSYHELLIYRVLLGFGMAMEFPIAQSMLSELIPAQKRGRYVALMDGFWPIGFISAGVLAYFILEPLGWRQVFLLLALPAVFVFVIRWWIPESPRWLEQAGQGAEAEAVLAQMEARVMKSLGVTQLPTPEGAPRGAVHQRKTSLLSLLRPQLRCRTLMIWGLWFFALLGFYGLTTWLGALLQQAGYAVTQSVLYTVTISVGGIPGFLTVAWLIERWGRKRMCLVTLFGSAIMATLYGQVAQAGVSLVLLFSVGFFMQFFMFGMWAVLYAYTPELYDTHVRATGSGCASAVGRIGSLLGPFIVGLILPWTGQGGVFMLGAGSFVVAAFVVWAWGIETKGLSLEAVQQQARGGDHP